MQRHPLLVELCVAPVPGHLTPDAKVPVERPHRIRGPPRRRKLLLPGRLDGAVRQGRLPSVSGSRLKA
jgi:hypothetical protein